MSAMATQQQSEVPLFTLNGARPLGQLPLRQGVTTPSPTPSPRTQPRTLGIPMMTDETPKDEQATVPLEPPPAYAPPPVTRTRLQEHLAVALLSTNPSLSAQLRTVPLGTPAVTLREGEGDDDPFLSEELSPIKLQICTRLTVSRGNNVVVLGAEATPSKQADVIAAAIVKAFKSASVSEGGLPMVDQDGRPRPVKIEVDAGISVEGSNNIVGTEEGVLEVIRSRHAILRQRMASVGGPVAGPSCGSKRPSVSTEQPPAKRAREGDDA